MVEAAAFESSLGLTVYLRRLGMQMSFSENFERAREDDYGASTNIIYPRGGICDR